MRGSITRRLLAGAAAGLAIGLGGIAGTVAPAHAEIVADPYEGQSPIVVSHESTCGALDITLENTDETTGVKAKIFTSAGQVEPVDFGPGELRIIGFAPEISYVVKVEGKVIAEGAWEDPGNCDPSQIPLDWRFDCDSLTVVVTNPRTFNQTIRITAAGGGLPEMMLDVERGVEGAEFPFDATDGTVATVTMADTTLATIVWEQPEDCDDRGTGGEGPETEKAASELPKTGTQTLPLVGAALGLLALGGAMYVVARRRTGSTA